MTIALGTLAVACSPNATARITVHITKACSIGPRPTSASAHPSGGPSLPQNGPLRPYDPGDTIGGGGWFPSAGFVSFRTDVPLENTWSRPVTVDSVVVGPPLNPRYQAPRLLGCFVVATAAQYRTVSNWDDFKGHFPVLPAAQGFKVKHYGNAPNEFSPSLALLMVPNGPVSYTSYVVVAYHTANGKEYTAVFNQVWLFCVRGEAPKNCMGMLGRLP